MFGLRFASRKWCSGHPVTQIRLGRQIVTRQRTFGTISLNGGLGASANPVRKIFVALTPKIRVVVAFGVAGITFAGHSRTAIARTVCQAEGTSRSDECAYCDINVTLALKKRCSLPPSRLCPLVISYIACMYISLGCRAPAAWTATEHQHSKRSLASHSARMLVLNGRHGRKCHLSCRAPYARSSGF
jgi:hypothetical protein